MAEASAALMERVERGEEDVLLPDVVVAEVVYVLTSKNLYGFTRDDVSNRLRYLLSLPNVLGDHKDRCQHAFGVFLEQPQLSYVDAYLVAAALEQPLHEVYSFDQGIDRVDSVTRIQPA